jgi:hypothetical protein
MSDVTIEYSGDVEPEAWTVTDEGGVTVVSVNISSVTIGTTAGTVAAGDDARFGSLNPGTYDDPAIIIDGGLL